MPCPCSRLPFGGKVGYTVDMTDAPERARPRRYRLTPDRCVVALLALEGFLLLSAWFRWFPFNQHKGWTVLVTIASGRGPAADVPLVSRRPDLAMAVPVQHALAAPAGRGRRRAV